MSTDTPSIAGEPQRLVSEAAAWRLLGCLFERPRPGWNQELRSLVSELCEERLSAAVEAAEAATEEAHVAHFGPGRPVSPREVSYIGYQDPGRVLSDLNAFYEAFGFAPVTEEPADHVAVEAAFVSYLYLKEAYARFNREEDLAGRCARGRALFLDSHLARLGQRLPLRLHDASPDWIRLSAEELRARVAHVQIAPDVPTCASGDDPDSLCCAGAAAAVQDLPPL